MFRFIFITLLCLFYLRPARADVNLRYKLVDKMRSEQMYEEIFSKYLNRVKADRVAKFLSHPLVSEFADRFRSTLSPFVRDPLVLNALIYLVYKEQFSEAGYLLQSYFVDLELLVTEIMENPKNARVADLPIQGRVAVSAELRRALNSLDKMGQRSLNDEPFGTGMMFLSQKIGRCVASIHPKAEQKQLLVKHCIVTNLPSVLDGYANPQAESSFAGINLGIFDPIAPASIVSRTGFIPGNAVRVVDLNRNAENQRLDSILAEASKQFVKAYAAKFDGLSDVAMIERMRELIRVAEANNDNPVKYVFDANDDVIFQDSLGKVTKSELVSIDNNPVWQFYGDDTEQPHEVFPVVANMIRSAESTVFIDMFFFGGTTGLAMCDLLLERLKENPQLRIMLLHDTVNDLGFRGEIRPVFNFLRAYMAEHSDRLIVVPSDVYEKKTSGIPSVFLPILSSDVFHQSGLSLNYITSFKGQADHTKVVIVDGNLPSGNPQAIVGSKNWLDSSGALADDESLYIRGPAAVVAFDNFYNDMFHALEFDWKSNSYMAPIYEASVESVNGSPDCKTDFVASTLYQKIQKILCRFDVLQRFRFASAPDLRQFEEGDYQRFPNISVKEAGSSSLRFGESSWNALSRPILNQDLEAIYRAKKQILISEQFIVEPNVVRALIEKAKQGLNIYIVVEGFLRGSPPGMPNILFLSDLKNAGVHVRFKTHAPSKFFAGEYHGKTLSIDGFDVHGRRVPSDSSPTLILGSANKDFMTLTGAFREEQVEVQDESASRQHDLNFWKAFAPNQSTDADLQEFDASNYGKFLASEGIATPDFLQFARWVLSTLYNVMAIR